MTLLSCALAPRAALAAEAAPAEIRAVSDAVPLQQLIITFKTHFDIGYTDMASNVVQRYRTTMIEQALMVCDQNRDLPPAQQFVWMIPGWPLHKIVEDWSGQTPGRKEQVLRAFGEGRFAVHALPFTTHTELLEPEDLVRGLGFSSRLSRAMDRALPLDAKMTDVPCHSWILPTLLTHAGVRFLHLGCNAASRSPLVPMLFWWEGPDGSRLLTMYTAESYGTGLVPPPGWRHKTWLALIHTGDNQGPPSPEEVRKLLAQARETLPGVQVRIGRLSDFAEAILAENSSLPLIRGDMPDTWIHGPMGDPAGAQIARTVRPAIAATESLNSLLRQWGAPAPEAAPIIAQAYEQSLLYGEHTWGGALSWVTSYATNRQFNYGDTWKTERAQGRFRRLESSWAEHTAYIETAQQLIQPVLAANLQALAHAVNNEGQRIVVYNPLPWKRDGFVKVRQQGGAVSALKSVERGEILPATSDGNELRFVAREVPSLGYCTFVPVPPETQPSWLKADLPAATLENQFLKVTLDPARGVIRSLRDQTSGRERVEAATTYGFGQFLYERFDAAQVQAFVDAYVKISADWATNELGKPNLPSPEQRPYRAASPRQFTWRLEQTPVLLTAVMTSSPDNAVSHRVTTKVILYRDQPYLDLEMTVHSKPADPWPEAGWICLPVKAESPQFRLGRLGSIVDPAKDIVPGANQHLFGLNTGLTVTDPAGHGLGLCPIDHPLVSLGQPGCWKYSRAFAPRPPCVFVNLFNNQWTTNFRLWNEGTWTSRVRVWAVDTTEAEPSLVSPSLEARYPLCAASADGPAGPLPTAQSGLALSRRGILVTAFGGNPDGRGRILRLWEQAGQSGPCEVHLPATGTVSSVEAADLRGRTSGAPITVRAQAFTANLPAFAPASFLLEP